MIKAVIFDMVGPLLQKDPNWINNEAVNKAELLWSKSQNNEDFLKKIHEDLEIEKYGIEKLAEAIANKYKKIPQIWKEVLPELKKKYKLAIINNGMGITISQFKKRNNFGQFFDLFINSAEENINKPDPRIYLIACDRLGVKPEECVFIDDSERNVKGAKDVGMQGIVYINYKTFNKDLFSLGLFKKSNFCR